MGKYYPRIADELLKKKLQTFGAVLIKGPKWCGKTSTAEQQAKSVLYMNDSELQEQNIALAKSSPKNALEGATPRLIDEWQLVPTLWDAVRFEVDHRDTAGQFILTGSAIPADLSKVHHSGIGRIASLTMRPMSLFESGDSSGEISLESLFDAPESISGISNIDLDKIAFLCCRGGWPQTVGKDEDIALNLAEEYYRTLVESDISRVDNIKRNPSFAAKLMRNYARAQGQQASLESLRNDTAGSDNTVLSIDTVYSYTEALRNVYAIEDADAWNPNLRSKTAVHTSNTRYFVDPSLATAALSAGQGALIADLKTFGFIFETLCIRDLRIYMDALNGKVSHYRDSSGLECDAVLHLKDGRYGLVQVKLGADSDSIKNGVEKLLALKNALDPASVPMPSFMMVLTGNGAYAYRRDDGIYVIPIGCLKP